ncbi:hypothetical protein DXG03_004995 [Asterophora parasitica]|uniref:GP-PDE domain-containing protein n=1 Tax=Asterophora parasitica TaxID=117018 RepID=A0A9P7KI58_9AGAR|nr:hypothetical protein DXG03_004995 [Asterophora parasitica]
MPDFVPLWHPTCGPQVVFHRGLYPEQMPKTTMPALKAALNVGSLVEIDVARLNDDTLITCHDRRVLSKEAHASLNIVDDWVPLDTHTSDDAEEVTPLLLGLTRLVTTNNDATMFLDDDAAAIVVFISRHMFFSNRVVVQLYPTSYDHSTTSSAKVTSHQPGSSWDRLIALVPILPADALPKLAGVASDCLDYQRLYGAGKRWIDEMLAEDLRIAGFGLPFCGIENAYNVATGCVSIEGTEVKGARDKSRELHDRVLLDLNDYVKTFPGAVLVISTYDNTFDESATAKARLKMAAKKKKTVKKSLTANAKVKASDATAKEKPAKKKTSAVDRYIKAMLAIPGNTVALGADVV